MKTTKHINPKWQLLDRVVAHIQINKFGKIFLDEKHLPCKNMSEISQIINNKA